MNTRGVIQYCRLRGLRVWLFFVAVSFPSEHSRGYTVLRVERTASVADLFLFLLYRSQVNTQGLYSIEG